MDLRDWSKDQVTHWGKNKIIIAIVLALVLLVALVLFLRDDSGPQFFGEDAKIQNQNAEEGELTLVGTMKCLPYREDSPANTSECVLGLLGHDGNIYALNAPSKLMAEEGDEVRVVGKYNPINTEAEEATVFIY
ncbi:MAG: hypothetical protein WD874_00125, partial [Parcubacteria group bacterium]